MGRRERRSIMLSVAAFATPIVIVQLMNTTAGGFMPAGAHAASDDSPGGSATTAAGRNIENMTERQMAAAEYAGEIVSGGIPSSPFLNLAPQPVVPPDRTVDPSSSIPELRRTQLTAIMSGPNPIAIINKTPYRLGDILYGRWAVTRIDAVRRSVTLTELQGGREVIVTVESP